MLDFRFQLSPFLSAVNNTFKILGINVLYRCLIRYVLCSDFVYTPFIQTPGHLWAGRRRWIELENILMGCAFLGGDNFFFSFAAEIICLAVWQGLSPTHTMTHFGENWAGGAGVGGGSQGLPEGVYGFVRLWSSLYLLAPRRPPRRLSCSEENAALKASAPCRRRVQRPAQRARFVWVISLTTRAAPRLDLMDPTYAVVTMPTSCQLRSGEAFVLRRDATVSRWSVSLYNKSPPQRSHQRKCFSSSVRSFGLEGENNHWHLIVKTECIKIRGHPSSGQIKAYLLGLDRSHTKYVGSCSLVDFRGLSRQKGIC